VAGKERDDVVFVRARDLQARGGDVWRRLSEERLLVVTTRGRPIAVLVHVDDRENVDDILAALRRTRARSALTRLRRAALARNLDRLTPSEIDAEIAAARHAPGT
jgi:hypothetical protein